jgi:hypothetical protein
MRVEIKTNGKVKDKDIKALYLMEYAMRLSSNKMRQANLDFINAKWNRKLNPL